MPTGSTIDLAGATLTLTPGDLLACYVITDTSAAHDGDLVMGAGSMVVFDDSRSAGFGAEGTAITLDVNGTIGSMATIETENIMPSFPWRLPAKAATVAGEFVQFIDSQGFKGTAWNVSSAEFVDTRSMLPGSISRLKEVVTIEPWSGTYDTYAKRAYSTAVAVHCYIARNPTMIIDSQGRETVSSVQVYIDGDDEVETTSRLTLPGGEQPVILKVEKRTGPGGMTHLKVIYA
jgi:hypothetical protein